jgi:hypothetical protein
MSICRYVDMSIVYEEREIPGCFQVTEGAKVGRRCVHVVHGQAGIGRTLYIEVRKRP